MKTVTCLGAALASAGLLLAGCSSTPVAPTESSASAVAPAPAPSAESANAGSASPVAASSVATVTLAPHLDPSNPIARDRSIYFEYDDFAIQPTYTALLERQGRYLASTPTLVIRIEGHADERGSAEYNLALGQKRAEAVLNALRIYGVKPSQMEATSWGEERPRTSGHDEAAWAQERRADLVYPRN